MTTPKSQFNMFAFYRAGIRIGFQRDIQYRLPTFMFLLAFLIEPIIYLAVWQNVAASQGGSVGGYTEAALAAYYITWTLVRVFNLAFDPFAWEWRIREGRLNDFLSTPIHPFHRDMSFFIGSKFVWTALWFPVAIVLTLIFRPDFNLQWFNVLLFVVALWGGFAVRFVLLYLMGLANFWTTRASAVFGVVIAAELLLSGRLVPLTLMPQWVESLAGRFPFKWTFQFPIEVLIGRLDRDQVWAGVGAQVLWAVGIGAVMWWGWKKAIVKYAAVGG
ncbi:MAG: ABC-2 family transporter protein [Acidimicrobiia bacterium]|nr:ABC-2 family transporter protein [Acidimicrobiia bacterium]MDH3464224.1 ABC-2 family transporter protein [Acidimicrobiia bacterium]